MLNLEKEIENYFYSINSAKEKFDLYKGILQNVSGNEQKVNSINGFLYVILDSLKFTFIVETSKLVNKKESKNIFKFIEYCKQHKKEFLTEFYDEFYNETTKENEKIFIRKVNILEDLTKFEEELKKYEIQIENLKAQRDKVYAHTDKKYFYGNKDINKKYKVTYDDVDMILNILHKNLNVISIDFNRRAFFTFASTIDDYKYIISRL